MTWKVHSVSGNLPCHSNLRDCEVMSWSVPAEMGKLSTTVLEVKMLNRLLKCFMACTVVSFSWPNLKNTKFSCNNCLELVSTKRVPVNGGDVGRILKQGLGCVS